MENSDTTNQFTQIELDQNAMHQLRQTRMWTAFLSITSFILMGVMLIFFMVTIIIQNNNLQQQLPLISILPMMLIMLIYFFPIYYLYKFSQVSKEALHKYDSFLMTESFTYLKKHYQFMGILLIIMLVLYGIVFMVGIGSSVIMGLN